LREALRADLPGLSAGEAVSAELASILNAALAKRAGTMALRHRDGRCALGFEGPVETPSHLVALVAYQVADLLGGADLREVWATNQDVAYFPSGVIRSTTITPGFDRAVGVFATCERRLAHGCR
jgi:hypothetical protein